MAYNAVPHLFCSLRSLRQQYQHSLYRDAFESVESVEWFLGKRFVFDLADPILQGDKPILRC